MASIRSLSYANPEAVYWLLALIPLYFLYLALFLWRRKKERLFAAESLQKTLSIATPSWLFWLRAGAKMAAWGLAVVALMGPRGNPQYPEGKEAKGHWEQAAVQKRRANELIFLIDSSASMNARDSSPKASRLEKAREIADEAASRLDGESMALIAFTSAPTTLVPLTLDPFFFRMQLRNLRPNPGDVSGTDLKTALAAVRQTASGSQATTTVVLLTDGGDNNLEEMNPEEKKNYIEALAKTIGSPLPKNMQLIIIGIGSLEGAELPGYSVRSALQEEPLKQLAALTGGSYSAANDQSLLSLVDKIVDATKKGDPYVKESELLLRGSGDQPLIYDDYFQYPLGLALLLLGFALFLPETFLPRRSR